MTDLIILENITAENLFSEKGKDWVVSTIKEKIKGIDLDVSTPKGRKEIASLAHKVAQSKTAIDKKRLDVVAEWKEKAKKIDAGGKLIRDALDELKAEVRKPLTDFENAEKQRISEREGRISDMLSLRNQPISTIEIAKTYKIDLDKSFKNFDFMEFSERAEKEYKATITYIDSNIERITEIARQKAELEELERKRAVEAQKTHEERLKREAEEKARKEAEAKAEAEKQAILAAEEEKRQEELRKIREEQQAIENARIQKEREAQAKLDAERLERERAEKERLNAERKKREEVERQLRIAEEKRQKEEVERQLIEQERLKREADHAHKKSINNAACADLVKTGLSEEQAKAVVIAIVKNNISNISISY